MRDRRAVTAVAGALGLAPLVGLLIALLPVLLAMSGEEWVRQDVSLAVPKEYATDHGLYWPGPLSEDGSGLFGTKDCCDCQPSVKLVVLITEDGFVLDLSSGERQDVLRRGQFPDYAGLAAALRQVKADHPDMDDVTPDVPDGVRYEMIVRTMDVLIDARLPNVALRGYPVRSVTIEIIEGLAARQG